MNNKKMFCKILPAIFCLVLIWFNVFGFNVFATGAKSSSPGISYEFEMPKGTEVTEVKDAGQKIWGIVSFVIQILAVAAVVFAGLRYMLASADTKADIKKQCIILALGAVLIFAATNILTIVANVTNDLLK